MRGPLASCVDPDAAKMARGTYFRSTNEVGKIEDGAKRAKAGEI